MNQLALDLQPATLSYREIPITQGKVAVVNSEDYESLAAFKWYAMWSEDAQTFYACRKTSRTLGKMRSILMHRQILGSLPGVEVDHRDGDGLNNRRNNIRLASSSQNRCNRKAPSTNTSGFKGVSFHKSAMKWRATICLAGKSKHIGAFDTPEAASAAYIEAAKRLHGEFANW